MSTIRVLTEDAHEVEGRSQAGRILVAPEELERLVGWKLRPEGLCRDNICLPVPAARRSAVEVGELVDLGAVAGLLGRPSVTGGSGGRPPVMAIALNPAARRAAIDDLRAPSFSLPDLNGNDHSLDEWQGQKKLLVTFASWCGCRYDLPGWQALHDELSPQGFSVIGVAMDNAPEDVLPFTEGITFPVLYDARHLLSELYAISNVPTVVWIDEDDAIVRPNGLAFGTDLFIDFTGVDSAPHLSAVRSWVHDGTVPITAEAAREAVADLSEVEILARLHFRIGADALNRGDDALARRHMTEAIGLAPYDWTVRRAAMPLLGQDPFGQEFLNLYEEWRAQGMPYHGLPATAGLGDASGRKEPAE